MKIKLQILATDIQNNGYLCHDTCPITLALNRAGFEDYFDGGTSIYDRLTNKDIVTNDNETYSTLARKVVGMYATKSAIARHKKLTDTCIPIEDFEHTLIF